MIRRALLLCALSGAILASGFGVARGLRALVDQVATEGAGDVPTTSVRRSDVTILVRARGELQGGGAVQMMVPRAGAAELPITFLRETGEFVEAGGVVAEFDASAQESDLLEAKADLEEARQALIQAEAEARVALETARLEVVTTEADVRIAELDQRGNEFLGGVQQRQNEIGLERARNRHAQAVRNLAHREALQDAGLAARRAAVEEAQAKADTARRTVADLTLRAPAAGYVQRAENTNGLTVLFTGMSIPTFQLGDVARPGQSVARIPDMSTWEVSAQIPETDRAFLDVGRPAVIRPRALPGRRFRGHVSLLGGSAGSAWNRSFNCRIAVDETAEAMRPGMTVEVEIEVETLEDVLWVPSQAVFEREGRWFVYRREGSGYLTHDVALVRRTESQAIVTGIEEGSTIALAEPGRQAGATSTTGVAGALPQ